MKLLVKKIENLKKVTKSDKKLKYLTVKLYLNRFKMLTVCLYDKLPKLENDLRLILKEQNLWIPFIFH